MGFYDIFKKIFLPMGIMGGIAALRNQGEKEANKDANNTGRDDLRASVYFALADGAEAVTVSDSPLSVKKLAVGLRAAADRLEKDADAQIALEAEQGVSK